MATNRRLVEMTLEKVKRMECESGMINGKQGNDQVLGDRQEKN